MEHLTLMNLKMIIFQVFFINKAMVVDSIIIIIIIMVVVIKQMKNVIFYLKYLLQLMIHLNLKDFIHHQWNHLNSTNIIKVVNLLILFLNCEENNSKYIYQNTNYYYDGGF